MKRLLVLLTALFLTLSIPAARAAEPGTEVVVVVDTSWSMVETFRRGGRHIPASDEHRRSILGALLIAGLTEGTDDALTVVPLKGEAWRNGEAQALRDLRYHSATPYLDALRTARETLEASPRTDRMLVFLTDGGPTDYKDPAVGRESIGAGRDPAPFDTVIVGLLPDTLSAEDVEFAERFLRPLGNHPDDFVRVRAADDLVTQFTRAWARALGSKALTGTLAPSESRTFRIGRYVTEVMVVVAGVEPSGPLTARLTTEDGPVAPKVEGDNACSSCRPPATHYATWRLPHDPNTEGEATLTLDRARSDATFGVILRYDLEARIEPPAEGPAGGAAPVKAWISWQGKRFDDGRFFSEDGFGATLLVDGNAIEMSHVGGGWFQADAPLPVEAQGQDVPVEVVFRNDWMEIRNKGRIRAVVPPRLDLRLEPATLDLGEWRGTRTRTERCDTLSVIGERPEGFALRPVFEGVPEGATVNATPLDDAGQPTDDATAGSWRVCAQAPGCCGDLQSTDLTGVRFENDRTDVIQDPLVLPVRFRVVATGWWTCWWPWLLGLLLLVLLALIVLGFLRGKDFHPDATVRVSGSKRQLPRATAVVLREQPRGRRGFYRNARVCLTSSGEFVAAPSKAAVHLEATGGGESRFHLRGPLEREDRRTRKFVPVTEEEALDGPTPGVVYRCGGLYLRFD